MRPKRVILLVDSDPKTLSSNSYALWVRGFNVITATNAAEALDIFASAHIDLVLSDAWLPRGVTGFDMAKQMKALASFVPVALLVSKSNLGEQSHADVLLHREIGMEGLIERIKLLTARKRGPRKGSHRIPVASVQPASREAVSA